MTDLSRCYIGSGRGFQISEIVFIDIMSCTMQNNKCICSDYQIALLDRMLMKTYIPFAPSIYKVEKRIWQVVLFFDNCGMLQDEIFAVFQNPVLLFFHHFSKLCGGV